LISIELEGENLIVYLLGKSPFEFRSVDTYLDLAELQSAAGTDVRIVMLHGAAVMARKNNKFEERLRRLVNAGVRIFIRKEDLDARAIDGKSVTSMGTAITTVEIMDLAAQSDTLVSVI
jgi:sulfur relay protein TusB/DsrH